MECARRLLRRDVCEKYNTLREPPQTWARMMNIQLHYFLPTSASSCSFPATALGAILAFIFFAKCKSLAAEEKLIARSCSCNFSSVDLDSTLFSDCACLVLLHHKRFLSLANVFTLLILISASEVSGLKPSTQPVSQSRKVLSLESV
jgi:hypothetical protein